ncbi:hypothetical protein GCM10023189_09100 [Nibrella saemangeumensis]|uniref:Lipocalin-like domain-containing protein n=1 Tax=Nibrella saemangeumensis TaxID=1084526 RepID=A0ABP8MF51_9BACT
MKRLLYLLFVPLSFTACKKDTEPEVDAATRLAGTYQLSYALLDDKTNPKLESPLPVTLGGVTVASGTLVVTRKNENAVDGNLVIKVQGSPDMNVTFQNVEVKKNAAMYDLYLGPTKIGSADGTNLDVDATQTNPQTNVATRLAFKAKKE